MVKPFSDGLDYDMWWREMYRGLDGWKGGGFACDCEVRMSLLVCPLVKKSGEVVGK